MGIGDWEAEEQDRTRFDWRRIEGNLTLLRPETLEQINEAIIQEDTGWNPRRPKPCEETPLS